MTQQQMIELIQLEYPDVGETEIRLLLNIAMDKFIEEAPMISSADMTVSQIANQRYFAFSDFANVTADDDVLEVLQVDINEVPMYRFNGDILTTDIS